VPTGEVQGAIEIVKNRLPHPGGWRQKQSVEVERDCARDGIEIINSQGGVTRADNFLCSRQKIIKWV